MGKVSKIVKNIDTKDKSVSKVKKLVNNPGVSKASAKLNLKDARVPLTKILKNKSNPTGNVALVEDAIKSLKKKKKLSKPVQSTVETKSALKVEQISIMKPLKRKSSSENAAKPPHPKKKGTTSKSEIKPQVAKKTEKVSKIEKKQEIPAKKETVNVAETIPNNSPKPNIKITKSIAAVDEAQVAQGISAVLKLAKLRADSKKKLFDGEPQAIFLQVSCIKVPKVPRRQLRMLLPHTLVTDNDDVVLFVGDLKKGRAQDFEPTINHYEDILREHGCTQITNVIPLTQVKTEYDQYELKRKLLATYDYFLTDGKIAGHLSHILGKMFVKKRKLPTSIKMTAQDLKLEIDNALKKTSMLLHSHGNSHIVQVAHTAMKQQEILNNVLSVCKNLAKSYPGGWLNIRSLILKTATSLSVPIYITLKSKNKVKVPVITPKLPKAHRAVAGELSTALGNKKVVVQADGTVEVYPYKTKGNKLQENDEPKVKKSKLSTDKSVDDKTKGSLKKKTAVKTESVIKKLGAKKTDEPSVPSPNQNAEDSEDNSEAETKPEKFEDSEDEIEEAEQAYLNQWQEESSGTTTTEEKPPKKKSKTIKKKKITTIQKKEPKKKSNIITKKKTKA